MRKLNAAAAGLIALIGISACKKTGDNQYQVTTPTIGTRTDTVSTPSVSVGTETTNVTVPKVEVKKETTSVKVPVVKVTHKK
jgi:hypothetical protein